MEQSVSADMTEGDSLPLSSLRLLVSPLQLMTASMWQVLKSRDVMSFWKVADFVSLVVDMVPELLLHKHQTQLSLGLRAPFVLELCRSEALIKSEFISPYLQRIKSTLTNLHESEEEELISNFLEMVQTLLKDPEERRIFFLEVFPAEYGLEYHTDLQMLFWEFLCRLAQLLPVPDLQQTVCWLAAECPVLEDCVQSVSQPTDLKNLLQHHKNLGHLDQHVPPSSMGDSVLSWLSAVLHSKLGAAAEQPGLPEPPQSAGEDAHTLPFMDDVAVEIIAVTDYTEMELGTDIEVVMEDGCFEGTDVHTAVEEVRVEGGEEEETHVQVSSDDSASVKCKNPAGPHDCPDCDKKFRFASSLIAHRVIHTGERPHRCSDCGRCFSFRQSLDRHRRTHTAQRRYDCAVCGESFPSLSARNKHKLAHERRGVYECHRCGRTFSWEPALARHLKTHTDAPSEGGESGAGGEDRSGLTSESRDPIAEPCGSAEVRTSGRKRRPTLKIQVINLQKHMATRKRKEGSSESSPALKPVPFNRVEHSYGSQIVSSKEDRSTPAFSCPQCSYQHPEEVQVQRHIDEVHRGEAAADQARPDEEGRFACGACDRSFRFRSLLQAHRRSHTGEQPFSCAQCGQRFSFKQSLERHRRTHAPGRKYDCPVCGESFGSPAAQRQHGAAAHMENGEYLCSECGRAFAWKSALVRHLKTHDGAHGGRAAQAFPCPRCDLRFSCSSYLNRHLQTHREERVHACSCGKSFAYRAALTAHQRIHQRERPHACAQCGKGFLYRGGLLSHMKIHSEEMPFMCSFCGKSFKRERNMKKHERCHTRENVFRCSQCDKSFVYKATLVRHELTHSGERPFLCSDCGKGFFSHAELLKHERFHTGHKPFQCPHCGKRFTQSCYLTVHLRYHTGARPYACAECDKSFLSANRLKRHQRTHSGERPYLCVECGKGFRQSYNLKMHQRTHVLKLP
ncbi:zinc finger protein 135-like isoform X2 [Salarias fasciatus]|uniref:zinc finger protein 135-like isoform X2 n=1 Tax=Salarias fasciatus TaxID=181472 RepID=UPI001176A3C9|nr:zinc finger protein 135-like isoform X2 [Salarias fasciatus]